MFDLLQHPPHSPEPARVGVSVSVVTHLAVAFSLALGSGNSMMSTGESPVSIIEAAITYMLPPDKPGVPSEESAAQWASEKAGPQVPAMSPVKGGTVVPQSTKAVTILEMEDAAPRSRSR